MKHTVPYVLDLDKDSQEEQKPDKESYTLGFEEGRHGACAINEDLITANIIKRVVLK